MLARRILTISRAMHKTNLPLGNSLLSKGLESTCLKMTNQRKSTLPKRDQGRIELILGPMFSGKSTELIRRIRRYKFTNYECFLIGYAEDARYSDAHSVVTHDNHMLPASKSDRLHKVKIPPDCSVIGVDEGQFFPDIVEFCEKLANHGNKVIVAALDGTYERKPFENVLTLVPLAESVVKLNAICMDCYDEAAFSKRITSETEVKVIGGRDKYKAVCRTCYNRPRP